MGQVNKLHQHQALYLILKTHETKCTVMTTPCKILKTLKKNEPDKVS